MLPAEKVLDNWGDNIRADFKEKSSINELRVVATADQPAYEMIASMAESIKSLTGTVADLNEKFDGVVKKNGEEAAIINSLYELNASLRQEVDQLSMTVVRRSQQMAATPEGGRSNKRQRVTDVNVASFDLEVDTSTGASETSRSGSPVPPHASPPNTTAVPTTNTIATTTTATNPVAAPAPAPSPNVATATAPQRTLQRPPQSLPLRHGYAAEQVSKKKSMKNNDLSNHLANLAQRGVFRQYSKLAKGSIPPKYGEKSLVVFCLELVDYVAERKESVRSDVDIIRKARTDMNEDEIIALKDAADQIVTECHIQLNEFMPSERRTGTTMCGMGKRIGEYKTRIRKAKDLPSSINKGKVQLIPLDELQRLEYELTQRHKGA